MKKELRERLLPHAAVFAAWPLASVISAGFSLGEPISMRSLPWSAKLYATAFGAARLAPEFLVVGALGWAFSVVLFSTLAGPRGSKPRVRRELALEPVALALAAALGIALEHPAVLNEPAFLPLRSLRVIDALFCLAAVAGLSALALGWRRGGLRGAWACVAAFAAVAAGLRCAAKDSGFVLAAPPPSNSVLLIGLDSLSRSQDVSALRACVEERGGRWHEKAFTPALTTNPVWTSILSHRLPSEAGVFYIFQRADWSALPYSLVRAASSAGYRTVSLFSDQFTTHVGTLAGFDSDRSGPVGWLQPVLSSFKDSSIFLPVILPRLPRIPGVSAPRDQSGTFAHGLGRELGEILAAGGEQGPVFAAAHVDYLHQAAYPGLSRLSFRERSAVLGARVSGVRDLSINWQYPLAPGEPLDVYEWKLANFQREVCRALDASKILEPARGNRVILFSDHGDRRGIDASNFDRPQYRDVVLAGFGVDFDPRRPLSLAELGPILGFPDASRPEPVPPAIQYAHTTPDLWRDLTNTARLKPDGAIEFEVRTIESLRRRLKTRSAYAGGRAEPVTR